MKKFENFGWLMCRLFGNELRDYKLNDVISFFVEKKIINGIKTSYKVLHGTKYVMNEWSLTTLKLIEVNAIFILQIGN